MATVQYSASSPYYATNTFANGKYLDLLVYRTIDKQADDVLFTINSIYQYRPDLLAYDLYTNSGLWWVFKARNPNVLDDPIFDFKAGTKIYIPKKTTLVSNLGIN